MPQHELQQYRRDQERQRSDRSARKAALLRSEVAHILATKAQILISVLVAVALPVIAGAAA
jgi:hypothetical protein